MPFTNMFSKRSVAGSIWDILPFHVVIRNPILNELSIQCEAFIASLTWILSSMHGLQRDRH